MRTLEKENQSDKELIAQLKLWRKLGPVGKLHNIIIWIFDSEQRVNKFIKIQDIKLVAVNQDESAQADTKLLPIKPVNTRWNSIEAAIERATKLRNPIDRIIGEEVLKRKIYWDRITANGTKLPPPDHRQEPKIVKNYLTDEDWSTLTEYLAILKPLKIATKRLESRIKEGKFGSLWEVLPAFEYLLDQFKRLKLNQYYNLPDRSPAYIAATVLHPAIKWTFADKYWDGEERAHWKTAAQEALQKLRPEYKDPPIDSTTDQVSKHQQRVASSDIDDYFRGGFAPITPIDDNHDEYEQWLARGGHREDVACTDPIAYWILKLNSGEYPRLARMALDLLSIPAMSSEPGTNIQPCWLAPHCKSKPTTI